MNISKATIIVDTSYVVFAKWYSALSWYRASINRNPDVYGVVESPVFQSKFLSMFDSGIQRVKAKFNIEHADVVFAKDCSRYSVWRRAHFSDYKEGRSQNGNFNSDIFNFVYSVAIPNYLRYNKGGVIGVDRAEADDVIGVMCSHISQNRPEHEIVIISNDNDCIQLVGPATRVVNLLMQDVGCRRGHLTPRQYLMSRILAGDRSDNISSVVSRCGPKTAARLVTEHDEDALREMYDPEFFDRNDLLMNLKNIPVDIRHQIIAKYDEYAKQLLLVNGRSGRSESQCDDEQYGAQTSRADGFFGNGECAPERHDGEHDRAQDWPADQYSERRSSGSSLVENGETSGDDQTNDQIAH